MNSVFRTSKGYAPAATSPVQDDGHGDALSQVCKILQCSPDVLRTAILLSEIRKSQTVNREDGPPTPPHILLNAEQVARANAARKSAAESELHRAQRALRLQIVNGDRYVPAPSILVRS